MAKKTKWWLAAGAAAVVVAGGLAVASRGDKDEKRESPFRLGTVQAQDLQVSVREVGVVDPETKVDVKSAVSGRVTKLAVREGAHVNAGAVLAEVEPDVNQAQTLSDVHSGLSEAQLGLADAERRFHSQKSLFDAGLVGRDAYRDAENERNVARQKLQAARMRYQIVEDRGIPISGSSASQKAHVKSPMTGVVIARGVELGETVTSGVSSFGEGTVLFTVADLASLIVRVNLNEVDIAKVVVGQPVRVTLDAYPQKIFQGRVRFIAPAAEVVEKIKVFEVEIALDEITEAFRTGMSANVEILGEKRDKALSIPLEALQRHEGNTVAYRLKKKLGEKELDAAEKGLDGRGKFVWLSEHWNEYFDRVPVNAGIATLERVEVLSGLAAADEVALEDPSRKKVEKDDDTD